MADQFVHLHLHTEFSLLDGACRIEHGACQIDVRSLHVPCSRVRQSIIAISSRIFSRLSFTISSWFLHHSSGSAVKS